jgi:HD-GYP domain-containing protein (c-di-GMP phosphodiesterase class II)
MPAEASSQASGVSPERSCRTRVIKIRSDTLSAQDAELMELGGKFIKAFHHMIHTVRIHQENNQLMKECISQFGKILAKMAGGEELEMLLWRGRFFLQGEKLLYRRETFPLINEMMEYFPKRGLQGLRFHPTFRKASFKDFIIFARLLDEAAMQEDPPSWLEKQLADNGLQWLEILREMDDVPPDIELRRKEKAKQTYLHALAAVKEVAQKVSQRSVAGIRKARRLAQTMVDLVLEDETLLLGLSTIRDFDDYTYTHSVNVALLSMSLGRRIGLSQVFLEQLAICGMFHDLGKVEVPKDIINKPDMLDTGEWEHIRRHPLIGVHRVLRLHASRDMRSRVVMGPFGHHLNYDLSGYPRLHFTDTLTLFVKILRIADTYDALTADRAYRPRSFSPDEALRMMWEKVGVEYDPILLKTFINMMGLYPVGTVLKLDSGELGLVVDYPSESDRTRPQILLLVDDGEGGLKGSGKLNLAERDQKIIKCLHPSVLGIQPSQLILQEAS